jgi:hypothetical protein
MSEYIIEMTTESKGTSVTLLFPFNDEVCRFLNCLNPIVKEELHRILFLFAHQTDSITSIEDALLEIIAYLKWQKGTQFEASEITCQDIYNLLNLLD